MTYDDENETEFKRKEFPQGILQDYYLLTFENRFGLYESDFRVN